MQIASGESVSAKNDGACIFEEHFFNESLFVQVSNGLGTMQMAILRQCSKIKIEI